MKQRMRVIRQLALVGVAVVLVFGSLVGTAQAACFGLPETVNCTVNFFPLPPPPCVLANLVQCGPFSGPARTIQACPFIFPPVLGGIPTVISGSPGADVITAFPNFPSAICGRGGNDIITGGFATDLISGGPGNDNITGSFGNDQLLGDGGTFDIINSVDGLFDVVSCGAVPFDGIAIRDAFDLVVNCFP